MHHCCFPIDIIHTKAWVFCMGRNTCKSYCKFKFNKYGKILKQETELNIWFPQCALLSFQ